jgi:hypothetical protein
MDICQPHSAIREIVHACNAVLHAGRDELLSPPAGARPAHPSGGSLVAALKELEKLLALSE